MCEQGRPEETEHGARFFAGEVSDAYLQKENLQRGYSVVIWRGRHVAEPTELSREEAAQYWLELLEAGRRIERALEPVKLNYETLGNSLPHLHTHVMPRYAGNPSSRTTRSPAGPSRTRRATAVCRTRRSSGAIWSYSAARRPRSARTRASAASASDRSSRPA